MATHMSRWRIGAQIDSLFLIVQLPFLVVTSTELNVVVARETFAAYNSTYFTWKKTAQELTNSSQFIHVFFKDRIYITSHFWGGKSNIENPCSAKK